MGELAHVALQTTIRPPRAVILFRGDANWHEWARLALMAASHTWAGAGHLLVPYDADGNVSDRMLPAVESFDPDHVLLLTPTRREWDRIAPGSLLAAGPDGQQLTPEQVTSVLTGFDGQQPHEDLAGVRAQERLANWCSPFWRLLQGADGHEARHQHRSTICADGRSGVVPVPASLVTKSMVTPEWASACVAVPRHWKSDAALVLGGLWGVREVDDDFAELDSRTMLRDVLRAPEVRVVDPALSAGLPLASAVSLFDVMDRDVTVLEMSHLGHKGAVVVGDSVEDFALAQACRVMQGFGLWLPTSLLEDEEAFLGAVVPMIQDCHSPYQIEEQLPRYATTSLDDAVVDEYLRRIDEIVTGPYPDAAPGNHVARTSLPKFSGGRRTRGFPNDFNVPSIGAVEADGHGTLTMTTPYVLPTPSVGGYFGTPVPAWIVDVAFDDATAPAGRPIGPDALAVPARTGRELVRSSRGGTSVVAASFGMFTGGNVLQNRLARPRLISPGMRAWTGAMAAERQLQVRTSPAGAKAELVARRLGGRDFLIDLLSGPMHPALVLFADDGESRNQRQKRLEVMTAEERALQPRWLDGVPYPSAEAMRHAAGHVSVTQVVELLDRLTHADLVRRGLITSCDDCQRGSFVAVDRLGRVYECPRCGAENLLASARWRSGAEPTWYFDLNTAFRQLLSEHGDVPLLAAHQLRTTARRYADVGELEFLRDGGPIAEIDLVAHVDGSVVVVEAKASADLGEQKSGTTAQKSAAKIADVARTVRADRVVLATTQESWKERDIPLLESALRQRFHPYPAPSVEVLVGLAPVRVALPRLHEPRPIRGRGRRQVRSYRSAGS
ncbi:hypothetical protein [Promicromonospora sp. NFX87]|uniref:hypothetical protein n=1 Tax=Promicromonospora sp. NFX87 TaxID=3402691 RepID=UPI003AFB1815